MASKGKSLVTNMKRANGDEVIEQSRMSDVVEIEDNDGKINSPAKVSVAGNSSAENTPRVSNYSCLRTITAV
jgi:hypothetical protein